MSKSLRQYRDEIRELRAAGYSLPASGGYRLSGTLSSGIKSAITRAINTLPQDAPDEDEAVLDDDFVSLQFDDLAAEPSEAWDFDYQHELLADLIAEFYDVPINESRTGGKS